MNKRKKVILISNMYPDSKYPNYGVFVKNTEDILKEEGNIVEKIIITKQKNKLKKLYCYIKHYINIIYSCTTKNYDVVYVHYGAHNSIPILLLKKINKGIKICTNLHGSDVVPETNIHKFFQKYVKRLVEISEIVIVPSNYYRELVSKKYKVSNEKVKIFPSGGINKKVFYREQEPIERKYIGFVGRIDYKKGWDVFLKFISKVNKNPLYENYKFLIIGNGKEINEFNYMLESLDIEDRIDKHDFLSQKELNYMYNQMDLFCFPTMREGESLGLVGLEAMACGAPVIGSNIGGLKDYIINGENGYLFEVGNVENLEEKISAYISKNESEKLILRENSVKTARKYEVNNIKSILIDIFKNI